MKIHYLTTIDVSIITEKSAANTDIWQTYLNSPGGRAALAADCPPEVVAEVLALWGDAPTVEDIAEAERPAPPPAGPTLEARVEVLTELVDAMLVSQLMSEGAILRD